MDPVQSDRNRSLMREMMTDSTCPKCKGPQDRGAVVGAYCDNDEFHEGGYQRMPVPKAPSPEAKVRPCRCSKCGRDFGVYLAPGEAGPTECERCQ